MTPTSNLRARARFGMLIIACTLPTVLLWFSRVALIKAGVTAPPPPWVLVSGSIIAIGMLLIAIWLLASCLRMLLRATREERANRGKRFDLDA